MRIICFFFGHRGQRFQESAQHADHFKEISFCQWCSKPMVEYWPTVIDWLRETGLDWQAWDFKHQLKAWVRQEADGSNFQKPYVLEDRLFRVLCQERNF